MYGLVCAEAAWITHFPVPARRFSISNDLKFDAERDLKDIDALNIPVHALNKVSPGGISMTSWENEFSSWKIVICAPEQKMKQAVFGTYLSNTTLLNIFFLSL